MGSATDGATRAAEQHQHSTDDQHDDACGPKDPDSENQTEQEEYKSENNHVVELPDCALRQTFGSGTAEGCFSLLQDYFNRIPAR